MYTPLPRSLYVLIDAFIFPFRLSGVYTYGCRGGSQETQQKRLLLQVFPEKVVRARTHANEQKARWGFPSEKTPMNLSLSLTRYSM